MVGNCTINGNGHNLDLATVGGLITAKNTTLNLNNITLDSLETNGGLEVADGGTVNLSKVKMIMSGDYTCTSGSWNIVEDVEIRGNGHTFEYSSTEPMTVATGKVLKVDRGVTFNYNASTNSRLVLNGI